MCVRLTRANIGFVQYTRCGTVSSFKKGCGTTNLKRHLDNCRNNSTSTSCLNSTGTSSLSSTGTSSLSIEDTFRAETFQEASSLSQGQLASTSSGSNVEGACAGSQGGATRQNRASGRGRPPKEVPQHAKDKIVDSCVKLCAVDLRPFNIVNGAGFKNLAQSLIDVGAKYGGVKAEGVLPHASTVSRKTSVVADKVTSKFLPKVKDAMRNGRCSLDADMWSDKSSKTAYLTTTTLLAWWRSKACLLPRLAILAQRIYAIPATSSNSERNFSRAGIIICDKRSQICPQNVNDSLVIHNYFLVSSFPRLEQCLRTDIIVFNYCIFRA